ncbi:MAG: Sensory box histidine kinase/response regulator [Myxococcales bacterium]|nr:Sensory box histidine kinase/response regulator [Myxococcales bacterium]
MKAGRPRVSVLLVDDDHDEHFFVKELLSSVTTTSFDLAFAASYSDGLARLETENVDVCLLDYHLGEQTGLDFIAELQRRRSTVPVVMLTARDDLGSDALAIGAGASDYLVKGKVDAWYLERALLHAIDRAAALAARLEAGQALRRSEERFAKSFRANPIAMAIEAIDDGLLIEVNEAFARLVGQSQAEILGHTTQSLNLWVSPADHIAFVAELRKEGRASSVDASFRTSDGHRRRVRVTGELIDVHAERCCLLVVDDITERLQLEARLMFSDRMASIGTLAAGVAHEINNPLAVVVMNVEMLAESGHKNSDDEELLDGVRRAAERIRSIVKDLWMFSRADEETTGPVDVRQVLEAAATMMWAEVRHRAQLVKRLAEVPAVRANQARLGQVFLNILNNAAQSIPEGAADRNEITLDVRSQAGGVLIEVTDSGCGIAPEVLPRVFDPFFTTKGTGGAPGLGLTICHSIVADFGGRISLESQVDRGTTVSVWLPEAPAVRVAPPPTRAKARSIRRGRVLIVDDEATVAHALKRLLAREHDVEVAANGHLALALITAADARYDAILCDVMMPEMTGPELFAEVARRVPHLAERMVFLTGGAFTANARAFLDAVGNPHFEKPVNGKQLLALVRARVEQGDSGAARRKGRGGRASP